MTSIPPNRSLPSKDASNYRAALKLYESKQYKKAIKTADAVLKKYPNHGETLAVKGLSLSASNKKLEGLELIRKGLSNDITSHVCWHILGLYYKIDKNYEEAVRAFTTASKFDAKNLNILRDLSMLQAQTRQFEPLVNTRSKILKEQPGYRMNWTALAVAQHLNGDYSSAVNTLDNFQKLLKETPDKLEQENSELLMYKNYILYDSGAVKEALDDLYEIENRIGDKQGWMEAKALYLKELGNWLDAQKMYQRLIARNPECVEHYRSLEMTLQISETDLASKIILYSNLSAKYPTSDAPQSILLGYLDGTDAEYDRRLRKYIGNYIKRGVPGAFGLIKSHYNDENKRKVISAFIENDLNPEKVEGNEEWFWAQNFKAHHYSKLGAHDTALKHIDEAIAYNDQLQLIELYMTKARVLKHMGDFITASNVMEQVRKFDVSDRFLNTKSTKYLLRADRMNEAIDVVSLFTKNEIGGNGIHDLQDMQALWFLTEQIESYRRLGDAKMELERLIDVYNIFAEFYTDQYDFHYYSCRRGTMRNYLDMMKWADKLYDDEIYISAVVNAVGLCTEYHDSLKARNGSDQTGSKKTGKTRKSKDDNNNSIEKILEEFVASSESSNAAVSSNAGIALRAASKFLAPLENVADDKAITWQMAFEIAYRQDAGSIAIKAIKRAKANNVRESWLISSAVIAKKLLENQASTPPALTKVQMDILSNTAPKLSVEFAESDENEYLDTLLSSENDAQALIDWTRAKIYINGGISACKNVVEERLLLIPDMKGVDLKLVRTVYSMLEGWNSGRLEEYQMGVKKHWPRASFL